MLGGWVVQIERGALGQKQEPGEELRALDLEVAVGQRRLVVVRQVTIELGVLFFGDVTRRALPERAGLIDTLENRLLRLALIRRDAQLDRVPDVIRIAPHE